MTLDEAIKHAEKVMVENLEKTKGRNASDPIAINCFECAEEQKQLAEWLRDYKRLLEQEPCEDAIRREDAINAVSEALEHVVIEHEDVAKKMINKLPPVKPQELCEDATSRILKTMWNCRGKHTTSIDKVKMEQIIRDELQPKQESCEDVIRREDALQALCKAVHKNDDTIPCSNQIVSCLWSKTKVQDYAREIYKLPSINSQPKTGHWVYKIYGGFHEQGDWYCSHCDYQYNYGNGHAKFCPECGYEMSEPPTEEVIGDRDYDWVIRR